MTLPKAGYVMLLLFASLFNVAVGIAVYPMLIVPSIFFWGGAENGPKTKFARNIRCVSIWVSVGIFPIFVLGTIGIWVAFALFDGKTSGFVALIPFGYLFGIVAPVIYVAFNEAHRQQKEEAKSSKARAMVRRRVGPRDKELGSEIDQNSGSRQLDNDLESEIDGNSNGSGSEVAL